MTTVAYDHQIFSLQRFGGISRYICEIAAGVNAQEGWKARVIAPLHRNEYLARSSTPKLGVHLRLETKGSGRFLHLINTLLEPALLPFARADLIHWTYYHASPGRRSGPIVLTVHDMIHELLPKNFSSSNRTSEQKQRCAQTADKIICVSHSTANDLQRLFEIPSAKIAVIHLGISETFSARRMDRSIPSPARRPYLLYVGERRGYKNFGRLLQAYGTSARLRNEFNLAVFGPAPFSREELDAVKRFRLRDDALIHLAGNDEALAAAYAGAHLFVYPSEYEGFGIPPLEAMSCGCPVVCSNSSSIPEVVGAAGRYFNPMDVQSIRQALEDVAFDNEVLNVMRSEGRLQSAKFSWSRCTEQTLAVYRKVLRP